MSKEFVIKIFALTLRLCSPRYQRKYGQEILEVFQQQLATTKQRRVLFVFRSILSIIWMATEQQTHALLGIGILVIGLFVTYDFALHAWSESALYFGIANGSFLLLTSIGLLLQRGWTIYFWVGIILRMVYFGGESTYWIIQGSLKHPADIPVPDMLASVFINWLNIILPIVVTLLIGRFILRQRALLRS